MSERQYGLPPEVHGEIDLSRDWREYMQYLYLPVVMVGVSGIRLPANLWWLLDTIERICDHERIDETAPHLYVYVSARRGYAHPGNALNRPGWHADGFGSDDRNYIWADRWPTRFAVGKFGLGGAISDDHMESAEQFEAEVSASQFLTEEDFEAPIRVYSGEPNTIYKLTPDVIHATPIIDGGGERSFFKVSVSPNKYNLDGNSHNHEFDYEWKMWLRSEVRNDPIKGGGDAGPQA